MFISDASAFIRSSGEGAKGAVLLLGQTVI